MPGQPTRREPRPGQPTPLHPEFTRERRGVSPAGARCDALGPSWDSPAPDRSVSRAVQRPASPRWSLRMRRWLSPEGRQTSPERRRPAPEGRRPCWLRARSCPSICSRGLSLPLRPLRRPRASPLARRVSSRVARALPPLQVRPFWKRSAPLHRVLIRASKPRLTLSVWLGRYERLIGAWL
jgi:hypothetical protein